MLIAHASSTCDVCLDVYNEDCSYHSIPCGHVFCLPCLTNMDPTRCPLCRHEFSHYTMRKLHLTLPSQRDIAARALEMKLVQSSPEMPLAESLTLFQEVQDWLEGEAQDEFLVLRAFAAVLCGFHEAKDKLVQNRTLAEEKEAALVRELDEARSAPNPDAEEYKAKYKASKLELSALRNECAELRTIVEEQEKEIRAATEQRTIDIQAQYAQIQAQAQLQVQRQSEAQAARRTSNPLPAPPRPVQIPPLKPIDNRQFSQSIPDSKGKGKEPAADADPVTSVFVPTLSRSTITKKHGSNAEFTTLVFKPPKRMPMWDSPNTSYAHFDAGKQAPPDSSERSDSSSRPDSYTGASDQAQAELTSPVIEQVHREPLQRSHRSATASRPTSYAGADDWTQAEPLSVPAAPPPESSARREPHNRSHHAQPKSQASANGWADPLPVPPSLDVAPPPESPRRTQRPGPRTQSREAYSRSVMYAGWPEAEASTPFALDPAAATVAQRPAWQGGTALSSRRASSPVIKHTTTHPTDGSPSRTAEYQGGNESRPAAVRSHTFDDRPPTTQPRRRPHQRQPSPSPNKHRRAEMQSEPEFQSSSFVRRNRSPDETPRVSKRSHHGPRASHSYSSHVPVSPSRVPSPIPARGRAHPDSYSYPAPPFALHDHHTHDRSQLKLGPSDSSPSRPVHTLHMIDASGPRIMPVGEV